MEWILFVVVCLAAVVGALGAALVRNLFHAALLLGLCLVGVAGLYLFLEQYYLACVQVVVYVGGVLVLVLFATLFSADVMGAVQRTPWWQATLGVFGAGVGLAVAATLAGTAISKGHDLDAVRKGPAPDPIAGSDTVGDLLVGPWFVPFLLAGFLLTVALVAAVTTVRRFRRRQEETVHV